jgi:hypothetical protein
MAEPCRDQGSVPHSRRIVWVDPNDPSAGFFRRASHMVDALEAGEPVTVAAWQLGSGRVPGSGAGGPATRELSRRVVAGHAG